MPSASTSLGIALMVWKQNNLKSPIGVVGLIFLPPVLGKLSPVDVLADCDFSFGLG